MQMYIDDKPAAEDIRTLLCIGTRAGPDSRLLPLNDDGVAWLTKRNMILRGGPGTCLVVSTYRGA